MTDMNYRGTSRSHQSEINEKRAKRLTQVREQCKEIAQQVRTKVKCEKQNQLRKIQEIKHQELDQWKRHKQIAMHQKCDIELREFGAAHIAAYETSCEDDGSLGQRREEFELLAAERGRFAMQHEQIKRDREAEDRLVKRKQKYQKNAGVQTNFITKSAPVPSILWQEGTNDECSSEEDARVKHFSNKRNIHKSSGSHYNPKNYTSNSIDSSNNCDSEGTNESLSPEEESEVEFNQISNLLKQKCLAFENIQSLRTEQPESPEKDNQQSKNNQRQSKAANINRKKPTETLVKKKVKVKSPKKYQQQPETRNSSRKQKVIYVDYGNKFTKSYSPENDLVMEAESTTNAKIDAKNDEIDCLKGFKDETLRKLSEARHNEALEKQNIRRDYDRLRFQLDEIAQDEQKARESSGLAVGLSKLQSQKQKNAKANRMNEAVEKSLKYNILTCPPVDSSKFDLPPSRKSDEVNVHNNDANQVESPKLKINKNTEVHDMAKLESLKNLLERINHQKKIILDKIEYDKIVSDHNINAILKSNEKMSKTATDKNKQTSEDVCKNADLLSRELKLQEREKQLEQMIKDLYRKQKDLNEKNSKKQQSSQELNTFEVVPPVEIIIKVKQPGMKKNSIVIDALSIETKKLYPKTPKKPFSSHQEQMKAAGGPAETASYPTMVQEQTQTSPTETERLKPILKKTESSIASSRCDESSQSVSTSYQSLPDNLNPLSNANKSHHKLNPALMHYIARLLGMNKNLGNQLCVEVSSVETPSSSVINTSGNNESLSSSQTPSFDNKRLQKLQEFISQNYSFLSEINETLERSQIRETAEKNIQKVEEIWRDNLRSKKSSTSSKQTKNLKQSEIRHPPPPETQLPLPKNHVQPPKNATLLNKKPQQTIQPQISRVEPESRYRRQDPITSSDMMNVAENIGSHMLNNYEEYTANCQKRIEGMTQMLEKIRLEKVKLIENSLSSTEFGHHTEYKDIAFPDKTQYAPTTSASDAKETPSQREDPPSEEINSILQKQTRPFGVSKDSGISMLSRPVTSSDFRDSPDTRMTSEERENTFQPILKDIPKPTKIKVIATDGSSQTLRDMSQVIRELAEFKIQKNLKPPVSLNRLSPHLEKPHEAHELSTIVEVETPSASKVNLLGADAGERAAIAPFISYEEYASKLPSNQQDVTNASQHTSMTALEEINLKSFKQPRDFGIQELSNEVECLSNCSSIIDIMEELKNRNLIEVSFKNLEMTGIRHLEVPKGLIRENKADPRKKPPSTQETSESESNDTLSGIQEIEKEGRVSGELDLPGMGLNWAAAMLKRADESKKNQSSNSNSSDERQKSISIEIQFNQSELSSPVTSGQPLNLRDFLTRELTKKSPSDDSLSNESSLSSQFMRSLLNATTKSSSGNKSPSQSSDDRLRTSTPVQAKGNNQNQTTRSTNTQAFLGESLSTVKSSDDDAAARKS